MSRRTARETVFKLVYEAEINGEFNDLTISELSIGLTDDDKAYFDKVLNGIRDNKPTLTEVIKKYARDFDFNRLFKVDIAILLVAIYEILFFDEIPYKVSANEAVELAKAYSTDRSAAYVNGILASVIKNTEELK